MRSALRLTERMDALPSTSFTAHSAGSRSVDESAKRTAAPTNQILASSRDRRMYTSSRMASDMTCSRRFRKRLSDGGRQRSGTSFRGFAVGIGEGEAVGLKAGARTTAAGERWGAAVAFVFVHPTTRLAK